MGLYTHIRTHFYLTACLLWVTSCSTQKVYFDCGARVDVADVQGLILSPGFPYNYSSGTHCVWQFFVPVGHQLTMEMFDFDVFESHSSPSRLVAPQEAVPNDEAMEEPEPRGAGLASSKGDPGPAGFAKEARSVQKEAVRQVVVQEQSTKMEMPKVSNAAKRSSVSPSTLPSGQPPSAFLVGAQSAGEKVENAISPQALREVTNLKTYPFINQAGVTPPSPPSVEEVSLETQQPLLDACPHDVLYISDLITFSSRFCGSNRPASSQLVFGSDADMVEVIMELITTTHWGRGFALLFHYRNRTRAAAAAEGHASLSAPDGHVTILLAALSGAAFFSLTLASILCVIFRPKLCAKGASNSTSVSSEVTEGGVANAQVTDGSELQLVEPGQPGQVPPLSEVDQKKHSPNLHQPQTELSVKAGGDVSQNAELDMLSNGLTEVELGTDEVFVISSGPSPCNLPFSPHTKRERFLRHSDTGPSQPCDWPTPDFGATPSVGRGMQGGARPRAWSVRTFQDFLPTLPQLHKRWCSWNSTSPFTKLVNSAPPSGEERARKVLSDGQLQGKSGGCHSESSESNASYPLTQPGQRQRRLNSSSNLRRSRFAAPCFGLLSAASDTPKAPHLAPQAGSSPRQPLKLETPCVLEGQDFPSEDDHVSVPVYAISEEEDRQPLVLAEVLGRGAGLEPDGPGPGRAVYEGKRALSTGSPEPQAAPNGSILNPRGKSEGWPPNGLNVNPGDAGLLPSDSDIQSKSAILHSTSNQIQLPSLSPSAVPCSLMGKDM